MIKCLLTEFRSSLLTEWERRTGKYLALGHGVRSIRHDLEPNIFPSGPPTQSISTCYYADPFFPSQPIGGRISSRRSNVTFPAGVTALFYIFVEALQLRARSVLGQKQ